MSILRTETSKAVQRRVFNDLSGVLRQVGSVGSATEAPSGRASVGNRPISREPWPGCCVGVRAPYFQETPLSYAEVLHGMREGLI